MSAENVQIVRRALEAWEEGDLKAAAALLDPDIAWRMPSNLPETGTYRGREEVVRRLEDFLEAWGELTIAVEELIDAGDRVVALVRYSGMGQESGVQVSGRATDAQVWTLRDGRVVRVELYGGTEEALDVARLRDR